MPALQVTDLYLLSAMMQTIGALWGIVFVLYVFVNEYFSRERGTAAVAGSIMREFDERLSILHQMQQTSPAQGSWPSPTITRAIRNDIERARSVAFTLGRTLRLFLGILAAGILVAGSIILDALVLWANDASYLGYAIWGFLVALGFLALVLLWEVGTNVREVRALRLRLDNAVGRATSEYNDAVKTIPDQ